jgi:hypothetical protein
MLLSPCSLLLATQGFLMHFHRAHACHVATKHSRRRQSSKASEVDSFLRKRAGKVEDAMQIQVMADLKAAGAGDERRFVLEEILGRLYEDQMEGCRRFFPSSDRLGLPITEAGLWTRGSFVQIHDAIFLHDHLLEPLNTPHST